MVSSCVGNSSKRRLYVMATTVLKMWTYESFMVSPPLSVVVRVWLQVADPVCISLGRRETVAKAVRSGVRYK
jgi:hypothetical protein